MTADNGGIGEKKEVIQEEKKAFKFKKLPLDEKGNLLNFVPMLQSPRSLILISFVKTGKTVSMLNKPNFLVGDCEEGTEYFEGGNKVSLLSYDNSEGETAYTKLASGMILPTGLYQTVMELRRVNRMKTYNELYSLYKDHQTKENFDNLMGCILKMKFPIFVLDTITHFMSIVEQCALHEYNDNLKEGVPKKENIKRVDTYGGVTYIRKTLLELKNFIETAAPFIVYNGHVKMKKATIAKSQEEISIVDIDLEGALGNIFGSKADAIGFLTRNEEGVFIDFAKQEEGPLDARPQHLTGQKIKLSDLNQVDENNKLIQRAETHWELIYPELLW